MEVHSTNLQEPSKDPGSALTQAGKVAIAYLEETGQAMKNQSYMMFCHMAEQALKLGESHPHIEFEAASLKASIAPDTAKDPSGWISPLWKSLEALQVQWAQGMTETAQARGLGFVPALKKVPGSPAQYQFLAKPLSQSDAESVTVVVPTGGLRYTSAAVAAPGAMLSATLRSGTVRLAPFLFSVGGALALLALFVLFSAWLMVTYGLRLNSPVTTAHMSLVVVWGVFALFLYRTARFVGHLGDLGIVMAPDAFVPFKEDHVTLEIRRGPQDESVNFAFVRYTAICPVCDGKVLLHDGEREFLGRIVGRCRLSPREHVYTFDQNLHIGHALRPYGSRANVSEAT